MKSELRTLSLLQCPHLPTSALPQIHARLTVSGALSDPSAASKLISHLSLSSLLLLSRHLPRPPTTFLFNSLIQAHLPHNPSAALPLYSLMLSSPRRRLLPNNYTFSFLLQSSLLLRSLPLATALHSHIIHLGWESYDFVLNGLLHLYVSCGSVADACRLFDRSPHRDVVTWTAMINGYAKSGQMEMAREMFDLMPERNAVSWSTMITSYAQVGMFDEALEMFKEMQAGGVRPNHAAVVGGLVACGSLGALDQGRWVHAFAERSGFELDRVLGTALVDMYAKCGCIEVAMQVFDGMAERDVYAYTSMIQGLSNHGHGEKAIDLFARMREEGVRPNEVTFICVLSSCSRMGLVKRGREILESMRREYGIEPGVEHYGCLVDLLGRAGLVEEAARVVREMPVEPDSYVLGALLNGCREHGHVELAKVTAKSLEELGLDHSGVHVLLSNMYASADRWEDVVKVRKGMEERKVKKVPGCSMIEVDGVACEFVAEDRSHPQMEEIMLAVRGMDKQLKSFGNDVFDY